MAGAGDLGSPVFYRDAGYGVATAVVAAGAGTTVIKRGPGINGLGIICRVIITTAGTTGNTTIYDSASAGSGIVLAVIPGTTASASAVIGYVISVDMPYANGLVAVGAANSPGFTVSFT